MTAIFISHSSADNPAAVEMKAWLEAQGHTSSSSISTRKQESRAAADGSRRSIRNCASARP